MSSRKLRSEHKWHDLEDLRAERGVDWHADTHCADALCGRTRAALASTPSACWSASTWETLQHTYCQRTLAPSQTPKKIHTEHSRWLSAQWSEQLQKHSNRTDAPTRPLTDRSYFALVAEPFLYFFVYTCMHIQLWLCCLVKCEV